MTQKIGSLIARRRAEKGLSQSGLAACVNGISGATLTRWDISRYETGKRIPDVHLPALAVALGAEPRELEEACESTRRTRRGLGPVSNDQAPNDRRQCLLCGGDDDMKRRELLRLGLGLGAVSASEHFRHTVDHVLGVTDYTIEDWEVACLDHAHNVLARPATEAHQALIVDLASAQHQLFHDERNTDLMRVVARLTVLNANVLTRKGDYDDARRWWVTARHAADASGDSELSVWVRGLEAAFGLYSPRPVDSLLALVSRARHLAGRSVTTGLMATMGSQAQALATLGRDRQACHVLGELTDAVSRNDAEGIGWTRDSIWYVSSWVHAFGGRETEAAEARLHVLRSSQSYQNVANTRLHEAIATARAGGYVEGVRSAVEVVTGIEPPYRSQMILSTARRVLEAVPMDRRSAGEVREFQVMLRRAITAEDEGATRTGQNAGPVRPTLQGLDLP